MCTENLRTLAASLAAFLLLAASGGASAGGEAARTAATTDPAMPAMLRLALARSQAADVVAAYHLDREGRGANPCHGLDLAFTPRGARIDGPAGSFALRLERFGRGDGRPVRRATPHIDGAWVEYDRGAGLTEWFVNLPRGVEQGWTVTERPAGSGPLVLELDTVLPPEASDNRRLAWSGLVYHRLVALDAHGRALPAIWMHDGAHLRIKVDDRGAAYPLLIDPWVEQAKLTVDDGTAGDQFGFSVALAGDSALVGAPQPGVFGDPGQGAAYVFTRSNGVWSQQAKLTAVDGAADDEFGFSVAFAGDTALVGAPDADVGGNSDQGTAYVFIRSGDTWSQQAKLTTDDGAAEDHFGSSVALAGDTALVGAVSAGGFDRGLAHVFTRSGGIWSQQATLTVADWNPNAGFGASVALAADAALVGAPGADVFGDLARGAAYMFIHNDGVWSLEAKLVGEGGAAFHRFGSSVALASDSALVGARFVDVAGNADQGAAYVFTRSDGVWSQQAELTADDGAAGDQFGTSVALEGDSALVGAYQAAVGGTSDQGAAYVFTRGDGLWSQQAKLTAADGTLADLFGVSVALAGDSALVGADRVDVDGNAARGAAYVFIPQLVPTALEVDAAPLASDGNRVFEPGEQVEVAPSWRNDGDLPLTVSGVAASFTGPAGAIYDLVHTEADYGTIAPGAIASCQDTEVCYALEVDDPTSRPSLHWDATVDEALTDPGVTTKTWTLHIGDSFTDVPPTNFFYRFIEITLHNGVTSGCSDTEYCPTGTSTRGQMPVFVLRAFLGPEFTPEPCVEGQERFDDVPAGNTFCPWIEELAERGVVQGCGDDNYCPNSPVTRAQMAIFLLRTLEGPEFTPPECKGVFADVPCPSTFADWVEELFNRGVTTGCSSEPLNYCPNATNIRGQMAVFLSKTFGLTLYGP